MQLLPPFHGWRNSALPLTDKEKVHLHSEATGLREDSLEGAIGLRVKHEATGPR